ncbi:MAG: secondary thiamine-phosphate synthase enzyme YjbQ [Candidatus Anstonellales archaeon]
MKEIEVKTSKKCEVVDITELIEAKGKAVLVFVPHATCGLVINEFEENIKEDMERYFGGMAKGEWKHNAIDDNAEAHLSAALLKPFILIPVSGGRLLLGTWQRVLLIELDGPRKRRVIIQDL